MGSCRLPVAFTPIPGGAVELISFGLIMGRPVTALILFGLVNGGFALQCMVGLNNETKPMECSGSWDQVQKDMKEKLGDQFESVKANLTSDLTGTIKLLKEKFEELKAGALGALSNAQDALTNNERKRRSTELIRAKRAGDGSDAEPEPEGEPEDDYYRVKKSLGGNTLKSCLPKAVADPLRMACSMLPGAGDVCVCQDQDLCNGGVTPGVSSLLAMLLLFLVFAQIFE